MFLLLVLLCAAAAAAQNSTEEESAVMCEEIIASFAHFNQTTTDPDTPIVKGKCVEHSEPVAPKSLPFALCKDDGTWSIVQGCVCKAGFEMMHGSCHKCPYYSFSGRNASSCTLCPRHSTANPDRTKCECESGFYQLGDGPDQPCYGVPSSVHHLRAYRVGQEEVELVWRIPYDDGGIRNLKYSVHCDADPFNNTLNNAFNTTVTEESAVVSGLEPDTDYLCRVTAINTVSIQQPHLPRHGMEVRVRTAVVHRPTGITAGSEDEERLVQDAQWASDDNASAFAGYLSSLLVLMVALLMGA